MKVAIINYGMGNLGSVRRALEDLGAEVVIAENPGALFDVDRIVLPGVGAYSEGMERLRNGWADALQRQVAEEGKPLLGICLGMQMLASTGEEGGLCAGLGLIAGKVRRIDMLGCDLRIPHVGWNEVNFRKAEPLFAHIPQCSDFYFVHSYAFEADEANNVIATTSYGTNLTAAVRKGHVFGCQFHPEKSSKAGRQLLRNFLGFVSC